MSLVYAPTILKPYTICENVKWINILFVIRLVLLM